jgi:hypothetical protein
VPFCFQLVPEPDLNLVEKKRKAERKEEKG